MLRQTGHYAIIKNHQHSLNQPNHQSRTI